MSHAPFSPDGKSMLVETRETNYVVTPPPAKRDR
jgi:hypothetical protein